MSKNPPYAILMFIMFKSLYLRKEWLYFETDFSFKIPLVCFSKWIHEITYSLLLIFWRQVCDVIYPPKNSNSKNKKNVQFVRIICSMFMGNLVETG